MSEIALILGAGLGGIGLGTIIAAGYLYSNQDREALINNATKLTPSELAQRDNLRIQKIIEENNARDKMQKDPEKINKLENLYTEIKSLDKLLRPINDRLDEETISEEERINLESERSTILKKARKIEKEIKRYDENLRQLAKNNLAFKEPVEQKEKPVEQEEKPVEQEENYRNVKDETPEDETPEDETPEDETPEDDLNMHFERSSSFSSTPPSGGSKYFTLTYTPKKSTKKQKSNINRMTKRNKINKRKTKRNKMNKRKTKCN